MENNLYSEFKNQDGGLVKAIHNVGITMSTLILKDEEASQETKDAVETLRILFDGLYAAQVDSERMRQYKAVGDTIGILK